MLGFELIAKEELNEVQIYLKIAEYFSPWI